MRPDPAVQARTSSRFTLLRALLAALVLAALAILPAVCRGAGDGSNCIIQQTVVQLNSASVVTAAGAPGGLSD